jgi:membrane associated rhomboid family serine protease
MFPIRDHNPSARVPVVTWALIALNLLVFVLMLPAYGNEARLISIYDSYAMVPAEISSGREWHTLLTSMFMHGGFWHIAGNLLFLWIFGDNLEDQMGHAVFLGFYLAGGVAADLAQIAAAPYSPIPTIGASGAIAAVMGGYLLLFPKARVDVLIFIVIYVRVFTLPAWVMLGIWFGLQLLNGAGDTGSGGGVAYWAHAGGFVAGFLLCLPLWIRRGGAGYWRATDGHPPHPEAQFKVDRTQIPRIRRR